MTSACSSLITRLLRTDNGVAGANIDLESLRGRLFTADSLTRTAAVASRVGKDVLAPTWAGSTGVVSIKRVSGGARMTLVGTFPGRGVAARPTRNWAADVAVFVGAAVLLWLVVRVGRGTAVPWTVPSAPSSVSTDPSHLPYYAARSLLRMFAALGLSLVFTFFYATAAARSRRAEKVLIPLLDFLQSVPVLGFLAITITGFIALFPGSLLGLECASIFAIFTSQAWNMTFAFYQSLIAQPHDLDEASRLLRLSRWQRFWRVDLPSGVIPLVWNGMMSFGGGWFFLTASEALSVNNHKFALPGIGAYVAAASDAGKPDEGAAGHRGHDRGDHRGQRAVLAAADSMGRTIPHRGIRGHRSAAQCDAGRPAALTRSWHRRPSARTAGLSGRPGDGGVRDDRASAENINRAPPHRRRRIRSQR